MSDDPNKKNVVYALVVDMAEKNYYYDRFALPDGVAVPYMRIREAVEKAGYEFKVTNNSFDLKNAMCVFSTCLLNSRLLEGLAYSKVPKERCFLFVQEPPTHCQWMYDRRLGDFYGKIFILFEDLVDNRLFFKYFHRITENKVVGNIPAFEDKKFCVMIQTNDPQVNPGTPARRASASYFSSKEGFDLFGAGWEGYPAWRGRLGPCPWNKTGRTEETVFLKNNLLKNYKFTLAYENIQARGFTTERLFQAMYSQCVPIYLGAPDITKYVPSTCFISRDHFSSDEELYLFLKSIDKKTYQNYLNEAQKFLKSPQITPFLPEEWAHTVMRQINEIACKFTT